MSLRRLCATTAGMALLGWLLAGVGGDLEAIGAAVTGPQRVVDEHGPDTLVLLLATVLAWVTWGWGALGLLLTAATALPGATGRAADLVLGVVLPAGARQAAATLVGLSLAAGPLLVTAPPAPGPAVVQLVTAADEQPAGQGVADWPAAEAGAPDWPTGPAGARVVLRGDCLWDIAREWLARRDGRPPSDAATATAVHDWWAANQSVIGTDPDLLLPGQVLVPPEHTAGNPSDPAPLEP